MYTTMNKITDSRMELEAVPSVPLAVAAEAGDY